MRHRLVLALIICVLPLIWSLDISITDFKCEQDLFISIKSLELNCNGTSQCTLGSYVAVSGYLTYDNNLDTSNLVDDENDKMYLSGKMKTVMVNYELMNFYELPVCFDNTQQQQYVSSQVQSQATSDNGEAADGDGEQGDVAAEGGDDPEQNGYGEPGQDGDDNESGQDGQDGDDEPGQDGDGEHEQGDNENDPGQNDGDDGRFLTAYACPANGDYPFSVKYKLPERSENNLYNWLATGWSGQAEFSLYARSFENGGIDFPLGQCTISFGTHVTTSDSRKESLFRTPSAAATAGIVLAVGLVSALGALYCYCCARRKKRKFETQDGDDITSSFRRMRTEDDKVNVDGKMI